MKKAVSITGSIEQKSRNKAVINAKINSTLKVLKASYPDVDMEPGGDFREMMKNFTELGLAFLVNNSVILMGPDVFNFCYFIYNPHADFHVYAKGKKTGALFTARNNIP